MTCFFYKFGLNIMIWVISPGLIDFFFFIINQLIIQNNSFWALFHSFLIFRQKKMEHETVWATFVSHYLTSNSFNFSPYYMKYSLQEKKQFWPTYRPRIILICSNVMHLSKILNLSEYIKNRWKVILGIIKFVISCFFWNTQYFFLRYFFLLLFLLLSRTSLTFMNIIYQIIIL